MHHLILVLLLYKGKGERRVRKNWRPISLLNVDYKMYTKILTNRLATVLPILVHPDQTSSVVGRTIQDSLTHVVSVIHHVNETHSGALILSLDHQAAFDTVIVGVL